MSGFPEMSSSCRVVKEEMHFGNWWSWLQAMLSLQMEGAATLGGRDSRRLYDKSRAVREADHSGMSGISCS